MKILFRRAEKRLKRNGARMRLVFFWSGRAYAMVRGEGLGDASSFVGRLCRQTADPLEVAPRTIPIEALSGGDSQVGFGLERAAEFFGKLAHYGRIANRLVTFMELLVANDEPIDFGRVASQFDGACGLSALMC